MEKLISCAFNMDTACVELRFTDGSICSIDCTAVENEVADNRFQRAELDYLIYNDPLAYADLVLNGDVEAYLNAVTEYQTYFDPTYQGNHANDLPEKSDESNLFHGQNLRRNRPKYAAIYQAQL